MVADDNLLDFITDDLDDGLVAGAEAYMPPANVTDIVPVKAASSAASATSLNLHLDSANLNRILPKDTFYAPTGDEGQDWLGDIDDALSFLDFPDEEIDLHEAHISTKLDLARAYLDMGDIEGARSTLEEVMVEGNDDQRREAEVLLHQTG
jgi:pilus assembly protein FimV